MRCLMVVVFLPTFVAMTVGTRFEANTDRTDKDDSAAIASPDFGKKTTPEGNFQSLKRKARSDKHLRPISTESIPLIDLIVQRRCMSRRADDWLALLNRTGCDQYRTAPCLEGSSVSYTQLQSLDNPEDNPMTALIGTIWSAKDAENNHQASKSNAFLRIIATYRSHAMLDWYKIRQEAYAQLKNTYKFDFHKQKAHCEAKELDSTHVCLVETAAEYQKENALLELDAGYDLPELVQKRVDLQKVDAHATYNMWGRRRDTWLDLELETVKSKIKLSKFSYHDTLGKCKADVEDSLWTVMQRAGDDIDAGKWVDNGEKDTPGGRSTKGDACFPSLINNECKCHENPEKMCPEGWVTTKARYNSARAMKASTASLIGLKVGITAGFAIASVTPIAPEAYALYKTGLPGMAPYIVSPAVAAVAGFCSSPKCTCEARECYFDKESGKCHMGEANRRFHSKYNPYYGKTYKSRNPVARLPYQSNKCVLAWKAETECVLQTCEAGDYMPRIVGNFTEEYFGTIGRRVSQSGQNDRPVSNELSHRTIALQEKYQETGIFNCISVDGTWPGALNTQVNLPDGNLNTAEARVNVYKKLVKPAELEELKDSHDDGGGNEGQAGKSGDELPIDADEEGTEIDYALEDEENEGTHHDVRDNSWMQDNSWKDDESAEVEQNAVAQEERTKNAATPQRTWFGLSVAALLALCMRV